MQDNATSSSHTCPLLQLPLFATACWCSTKELHHPLGTCNELLACPSHASTQVSWLQAIIDSREGVLCVVTGCVDDLDEHSPLPFRQHTRAIAFHVVAFDTLQQTRQYRLQVAVVVVVVIVMVMVVVVVVVECGVA